MKNKLKLIPIFASIPLMFMACTPSGPVIVIEKYDYADITSITYDLFDGADLYNGTFTINNDGDDYLYLDRCALHRSGGGFINVYPEYCGEFYRTNGFAVAPHSSETYTQYSCFRDEYDIEDLYFEAYSFKSLIEVEYSDLSFMGAPDEFDITLYCLEGSYTIVEEEEDWYVKYFLFDINVKGTNICLLGDKSHGSTFSLPFQSLDKTLVEDDISINHIYSVETIMAISYCPSFGTSNILLKVGIGVAAGLLVGVPLIAAAIAVPLTIVKNKKKEENK